MRRLGGTLWLVTLLTQCCLQTSIQHAAAQSVAQISRERVNFDFGWRFAFGHASDRSRDYDASNSAFSYLAKTGFATGAAAAEFDDRAWRELDLPHDWAVETPFDGRASGSHGSKAIGRHFPEASVGWYRKTFPIPAADLGKRISLEFDGVFRDCQVWVNGHYLGREESGYTSFVHNLTECLNYGGHNVVAVRVDASLEEGWFYEGAGIYRHVWLVKTNPVHIERYGTCVTSKVSGSVAEVTVRTALRNESLESTGVRITQTIIDSAGKQVARTKSDEVKLPIGERQEPTLAVNVEQPQLWSLETPQLYQVVTELHAGNKLLDKDVTSFGIRTIEFDPEKGFFLNGNHVRLHGVNNHQDHAGVGGAIPDALQEFRIARLKEVGCNAYRCSHHPPSPELLDCCDRLGMLVIDENRAMGTSAPQLQQLEQMIRRDRNHPSIILWSIGNEEWGIEGNEKGERVASTMQALVQRLDPTRRVTVASSGNWGGGVSIPIDVMGFNYYTHGNTDEFHQQFPTKPSIATEEGSTFSTRGVYFEDRARQHLTAYDENCPDWGSLARNGWGHYANRNYVAGVFIWTGFDYRGETTPFEWPAISSQFGILDTCGFRKDNSYYYQAQWTDTPFVHLFPHWNWSGKERQPIRVWAHSNCDQIELFLNDRSLGRQDIQRNSHAEWRVPYEPSALLAKGWRDGVQVAEKRIDTTGPAVGIKLTPHRSFLNADGHDVAIVTVEAVDAEGRHVPTADHEISFQLTGAGRFAGVGNGDPSSHEPDQFLDTWSAVAPEWKCKTVAISEQAALTQVDYDDSAWDSPTNHSNRQRVTPDGRQESRDSKLVYRGSLERPELSELSEVRLLIRGHAQASVFFNGERCDLHTDSGNNEQVALLKRDSFRSGKNVITILTDHPARPPNRIEAEVPAILSIKTAAPSWKRRLFNGYAQLIVRSTEQSGTIVVTATASGAEPATLTLRTTR